MKDTAKAFLTIASIVFGLVGIYSGTHSGPYDGVFEAVIGVFLLSFGLTAVWVRFRHKF